MSSLLRRSVALTGAHARAATASVIGYQPPPREECSGKCIGLHTQEGTCQPLLGNPLCNPATNCNGLTCVCCPGPI